MFNQTPLPELLHAARTAAATLGLRYCPVVIRDEATAHRIAARQRAGCVMLGENAYWVVCLADADRLDSAGYEWAPSLAAQ